MNEDWAELRLRGPAARSLVLAGYLSLIPAAAMFLATVVLVLLLHVPLQASDAPLLFYTLFGVFITSTSAGVILTQMGMTKLRWEVERGYVTMPYDYRNSDLRDPRDGRILRPAGTPGGRHMLSVSLSEWRRASITR